MSINGIRSGAYFPLAHFYRTPRVRLFYPTVIMLYTIVAIVIFVVLTYVVLLFSVLHGLVACDWPRFGFIQWFQLRHPLSSYCH